MIAWYASYRWTIVVLLGLMLQMAPLAYADVYDKEEEVFFTAARDRCIVDGRPVALNIGNALAHGTDIHRRYVHILSSEQFGDHYGPQPIDLAYAFYLIAQRIGSTQAKSRIDWLYPYMSPGSIEVINTIIYRKYSNSYLRKCFSLAAVSPQAAPQPQNHGASDEWFKHMMLMDNGQ